MQCTVSRSRVKVLVKSLQCIAKVADTTLVQCESEGLTLRGLSHSQSALATFFFPSAFFSTFRSPPQPLIAQASPRAWLCALRGSGVAGVRISVDLTCETLTVDAECDSGVTRTAVVILEDIGPVAELVETLSPDSPNGALAEAVVSPQVLAACLGNFHSAVQEATMTPVSQCLRIASFVHELDSNRDQVLHTAYTLDARDMLSYTLGQGRGDVGDAGIADVENTITFCLKEFKAMLGFVDGVGDMSLHLYVDTPGNPMIVRIGEEHDNGTSCKAELLLATVRMDSDDVVVDEDINATGLMDSRHMNAVVGVGANENSGENMANPSPFQESQSSIYGDSQYEAIRQRPDTQDNRQVQKSVSDAQIREENELSSENTLGLSRSPSLSLGSQRNGSENLNASEEMKKEDSQIPSSPLNWGSGEDSDNYPIDMDEYVEATPQRNTQENARNRKRLRTLRNIV